MSGLEEFKDELETWAIGERMMASQIRFGAFLEENVGLDTVAARRAKEREAEVVAQSDPSLRASSPQRREYSLNALSKSSLPTTVSRRMLSPVATLS